MSYNSTGRVVHDADAHIMETPGWLVAHADPSIRDRIESLKYGGGNELRQTGDPDEQLRDLETHAQTSILRARDARRQLVLDMRDAGLTYGRIAAVLGVHRSRAQQLDRRP